jgi:hypothetical protein
LGFQPIRFLEVRGSANQVVFGPDISQTGFVESISHSIKLFLVGVLENQVVLGRDFSHPICLTTLLDESGFLSKV